MISLRQLFFHSSASKASAGLTQAQREAILDLLNYCSYADREIAHSEEIAIDDLEFQLGWDDKIDFDYSVNRSIGAVRAAIESKDQTGFLQRVRARLDTKQSREIAIKFCAKLIQADGRVTGEENATLAAVKAALS